MYRKCRIAPSEIRRQLRIEAGFGCAICGKPLLENAHIIPYHETQDFPFEDMLALCPYCHTEADQGHYPEWFLREKKKNPYNRNRISVHSKFLVTGEKMIVNIGSFKLINTQRIVTVDDFDLISIKREEGLFLLLDLNLFNKQNQFIALINENQRYVDRRFVWDIVYRAQPLVIRNRLRDIALDIQIKNEEIFITGTLYYMGFPIIIKQSGVTIGGYQIIGTTAENAVIGIDGHTH